MAPVKCGCFPTLTVLPSPILRHPGSISLKHRHQFSILSTWDSNLLLLDDSLPPIWILYLGTEKFLNTTSTALLMEEVTSLGTTAKFSLFYSEGRLKPGAPDLCRLFEYSYVKLVHTERSSVQNVWIYAWTTQRKPKSLRDSDLKLHLLLMK